MTTDRSITTEATSIWDDRYAAGEIGTARQADDTDPIDYTQHDFLHRHFVTKPMTGVPSHESYNFLLHTLFGDAARGKVLAVGSGLAMEEQDLVASGILSNVDAYELSEVAVNTANARIASAGMSDKLRVHAGDVTKAGLAEGSYDAVYVNAAIHHFFNIEEMMDFFHYVLKPGGLLVYNEYVGPDHHMYHDKVMAILDKVNACLDEKLRYDELRSEIRSFVPRATLEWMKEMDPSEGVHASLILPLTYQKFDVVQRFDYGGTLMRPFWVGILNNFDFSDGKDQTIARLIGLIEELLMDAGQIPSYHTIVAARKGTDPAPKPLLDNEVLSYKTHGHETDKLIATIFKPQNVISCVDFTDENWERGVLRAGPIKLLLPGTPQFRAALSDGKRLVLGHDKAATIVGIEEAGEKIVLECEGPGIDRRELQAPARYWVSGF